MYHSWQDLLFLHWTFKPDLIQQLLPPGLHVDTFDGHAWLGVVPFFMRNIRPWWCPAIPGLSHFQELNLRTYVVDEQGTPGVWFLSLDADWRWRSGGAERSTGSPTGMPACRTPATSERDM